LRPCVVCQVSIENQARFCPSCGAEQPKDLEVTTASDPLIGHVVDGKYRLDVVIGIGGMGRVYRAKQLSLDKNIVIKILHDKYRDDDIIVQRFQREAKASSRLSHPNSIQIIDFGMEDKVLYMAMEYLDGVDLFQLFKESHPLGEERIAHILVQVCTALGEAHGQNIIHRDLKPENIMVLNRSGQKDFVKVLDFGIAKILDSDDKEEALTQVGMVCGTPEYMSPEQARGERLDPRSDIYALGVLLYQLSTGELPFSADTAVGLATKHILEEPIEPRERSPALGISVALESIIMRAMAKSPDDRFSDVLKMADALMFILEGAQGSWATMPEIEAVATEKLGPPVRTRAMLNEVSEENIPTDPGTQSDTALIQSQDRAMISVDSPHSELHTHELQAVGAISSSKILMATVGLFILVGFVVFMFMDSSSIESDMKTSQAPFSTTTPAIDQVPTQALPDAPKTPEVKQAKPTVKASAPPPPKTTTTPSKARVRPKALRAKTVKTKTVSKNRKTAQRLYQEGNNLIAQGSLKQGFSKLKKAQQADPSFPEVYRALATAHKMNGDDRNACRSINQFLKKKKLGAGRQNAYQKRYCK
jgi:serine/threonine protein kinase